jgi:Holliday junction resolvasome RuvABC endonuclease subunit
MRFVGIDPSTYTGMVCLSEGMPDPHLVHFAKAKGMPRIMMIAQRVGELLDEWQPDGVCIEGYAYGNVNTLVTLVEVGTVIRVELYKRNILWTEVAPPVLKKWVTGKGNATKADMGAAVRAKWDFYSKNDDVVDAYALARMAQRLAEVNHAGKEGVRFEDL